MRFRTFHTAILALLAVVLAGCDPDPIDPDSFDNKVTVSSSVTPDNGGVSITRVASRTAGWLVIRRDNGSNAPLMTGEIGRTAIQIGVYNNVAVPLSIEPTNGQKLWATLHTDDGVVGTYEYTGAGSADQPALDSLGNQVTASFTISMATPSVTAARQTPSSGSVTLQVTAAEDGWLALYSSGGNGEPSTLIGRAHVNRGSNGGVMVKMDTLASKAVDAGGKLWGVLHVDRGVEGTFEFPGTDFEVKVNGTVVRSSFTIDGASPSVVTTPKRIVSQAVSVDRVDAATLGWIVVHETDGNGDPILGTSIGRARVGIGTNLNIPVSLEKTVAAGTLLMAVLHRDDGSVGRYEYQGSGSTDAPVIDPGTSFPVQVGFRILQ